MPGWVTADRRVDLRGLVDRNVVDIDPLEERRNVNVHIGSVDLFRRQNFAGLDVFDAAGADVETFLVEAGEVDPTAQLVGAVISELV